MRDFCRTLFGIVLFLSQIALADEGHQLETTLNHDRFTWDSGSKTTDTVLDATYYLSKVDAKTYPLKEAEFVARISSVGIGIGKGNFKSALDTTSDEKSFSLIGTYMNPNRPYVISAELSERKWDSSSGIIESESKSLMIAPGYFLRDNLLVQASFIKYETDYTTGATSDYDATLLSAKWLHDLPSGKAYNLVAGVARANSDSAFSGSSHSTAIFLSSDYYVMRSFSVGASASVTDASDSDSNATSYGLSSSWFITPRLFTKLSGIKYNGDSTASDNVSLTLGMRL